MRFWNLEPSADGESLDISIFGDIDMGGFFGEDGVASSGIAEQLKAHASAKRINVRINSRGGDAFGGIAIYNLLRAHGAEVVVTVDGLAASAASVIAMAGRVVMGRGAMMMVHNPWTIAMGGAEDLRQTADVLDKLRDSLVTIYQAKTGKKPAELRAVLKAETWLTAEEAKAAGFADEIADKPVRAKAEGDLVILNSIGFKRAGLPAPILAMADEPVPAPAEEPAPEPAPEEPEEAPAEPQPDPANPVPAARALSRDLIAAEAPALLAQILEEGRAAAAADQAAALAAARAEGEAAGIAAERARLRAIDELDLGEAAADLVLAAKYSDKPGTAESVAVAAVKLLRASGSDRLAARRTESKDIAGIKPAAPTTTQDAEIAAAKSVAAHVNNRRGGSR